MCRRSPLLLLLLAAVSSASTLRQTYDAWDLGGPDNGLWYRNRTNDAGTDWLSWGASYVMMSYVTMYRATGDARYLDRLIYLADGVLDQRDSVRGVQDYRGQSNPCWRSTSYSNQPMCFAVHTGMIAYPMAELAVLLKNEPALGERKAYDCKTYAEKAAVYVQAGRDAVAIFEADWRTQGADSGYYVFPPSATFYPYAGQEMPVNQMNAMGRLLIALADATGEATYREKARRLANHFKAMLSTSTKGGYRWSYWSASYVSPGEDISHAAINVEFAIRAARSGIVFTGADLKKFAITFVEHVYVDSHTTYDAVGGTGAKNTPGQRSQTGRWVELAEHDPAIHAIVRDIYAGYSSATGSTLLGMAYLVLTERFVQPFRFGASGWDDLGDRRQASSALATFEVTPASPSIPQLTRLEYSAQRLAEIQQWNGGSYVTVARLAPTDGGFETAHVAFRPQHYFDAGMGAVRYQVKDAFVAGEGLVAMVPPAMTPPAIVSAPPSSATAFTTWSYVPTATGALPHAWTFEGPFGASIDPSTGELTWTPTDPGTAAFVLTVRNDHGIAEQAFTVSVAPGVPSGPIDRCSDGGFPADAGVDGGAPADGGAPPPPDAGADAGLPADAGTPLPPGTGSDAGIDDPGSSPPPGCGCHSGPSAGMPWALLVLIARALRSARNVRPLLLRCASRTSGGARRTRGS